MSVLIVSKIVSSSVVAVKDKEFRFNIKCYIYITYLIFVLYSAHMSFDIVGTS